MGTWRTAWTATDRPSCSCRGRSSRWRRTRTIHCSPVSWPGIAGSASWFSPIGAASAAPIRCGPTQLTPEDWADDLVAVLDHAASIGSPSSPRSTRRYPAMALAALHPDRVERLCLLNAFADGPALGRDLDRLQHYETALDEGFETTAISTPQPLSLPRSPVTPASTHGSTPPASVAPARPLR